MGRASFVPFLILVLAGCSRMSTAMPSAPGLNSPGISSQVWQRGNAPVRWELIPAPKSGLWESDPYGLATPLADRENRIWLGADDSGYEGACTAIFQYNMSGSIVGKLTAPANNCGGPASGPPVQLVGDTNGNIWFNWGRLTEYNEAGAVIGDYSERIINRIAPGLAGDMWYTTNAGGYNYVVRIRNGAFHFFRLPSSPGVPTLIAVGGDGTVWFTLNWHLAKLNPSTSQVTTYSFSPGAGELYSGPDGNVWYASGTTLVRISSPSGTISRFPLTHNAIGDIAVAADKTFWLDYRDNGPAFGVLNVTTNGTVKAVAACPAATCNTSTGDYLNGLALGPDGNVWTAFTSPGRDCSTAQPPCALDPYEGLVVYVRQSIDPVPSSVTFSAPRQMAIIKVSESNYTGAWTASTTQPSVVAVVKWIAPNELEVKAVGTGTGRIIIRDSEQNYYGESITVN